MTVLFQFQLAITMVHAQVQKHSGTIEFMHDIIQCRHNCVRMWDNLIGFPHVHIQSHFFNRQFQCYYNR